MLVGRTVLLTRTEHSHELSYHLVPIQPRGLRGGDSLDGPLVDTEVPVGQRRDLRQMGNAEDLPATSESAQVLAHRACGMATDAGVDLVKDE